MVDGVETSSPMLRLRNLRHLLGGITDGSEDSLLNAGRVVFSGLRRGVSAGSSEMGWRTSFLLLNERNTGGGASESMAVMDEY
jgi:hypothetical protein